MPLSRHFYSLDEVQAALSFSSSQTKEVESLFWCQELMDSGCASEAISTLFDTWMWQVGPFRLQWLLDAWATLGSDEICDDAILLAAYRLSSLPYSQLDNSLWNILALRAAQGNHVPDRVTQKSPAFLPFTNEKECFLLRAMFQGKAKSAWWITTYLDKHRVEELLDWYVEHVLTSYTLEYRTCLTALRQYDKLLGYRSEEYDVVTQCIRVIMLCLCTSQQLASFRALPIMESKLQTKLQEWMEVQGSIGRRIYSIPSWCLYGTTVRGNHASSQHNRMELYCVEKYMIGCPFWDEKIMEYGEITENGQIIWKSEEDRETFYEENFPEPIPDEWTMDEKNKSHGAGLLESAKRTSSLKQYSIRFLSKLSRLCWNTSSSVASVLEDLPCEFPHALLAQYLKSSWKVEDLSVLRPVRKMKKVDANLVPSLLCTTKRGAR
jgi:hypothetical protein